MTAFGQGVNSLWRREMRALGPLFRAYALLLGLVLLATLVNPYGYRLHLLPFQLTDTEAFLKHILEWNTPALARNVVYRNVAMVLGVITAVPLIMSLRRRETVLLIWFLAFAFLGTRAVRHSAIFALVSLVVIAEGAGMGWSARSARTRSVVGIVAITLMALLVLLTLTGWLWWMWGSYRRVGLHPYPWRFSESGAEFVERVKPEGKMFNDYNLGGYLLWELYPEYQVAIDGRLIVYGGELVDTTLSIVNVQRPWEPFFQEHDIHWAFLANEAEQLIHALWVHPDWSLVHVDARSVVFVDRHGRNATIADEFGLAPGDLEPLAQIAPVPRGPRWMAPPVPYESVRRVKLLFMLGRAELASRVNEAQHAATPKDPSVNTERPATLLHAARIHMRLENWPEAEQALRTLVEVDEASRDGWNNLGVLMARTGQPEKAQAAWERALELDPANAAIRQNLERLTAQQASGETPLNRTIGTDQDPNPLFPTQPSLE
jgi:tetratricopeptide (TPR) repeat protein